MMLNRVKRVILSELAMYPGRASLIGRIVLASTIVMLLIMVFRIPGAALGAYYPLLLSRDSPRSTMRSALRTGFLSILGTAEIVFGAMFFAGSPFLHFFWVAGTLFVLFFLISSLTIYDAALALGLMVAAGITTWDLPVSADQRLRLTLFTTLSILIACVVSVFVEYVFAHTHAPDAVLDGIRQRLNAASKFLRTCAEQTGEIVPLRNQLAALSTKGTGHLRERLAHSNYDLHYKERLAAALSLSGRIVELTATLSLVDPPSNAEDRNRCSFISSRMDNIDAWLLREESPEWFPLPEFDDSTPLLFEIERNVDLLAESLSDEDQANHHLPEPGEQPSLPSFAPDAFTNKAHLRFAIRGTLSALACYLVYMSVGWIGLGASTATCILTALSNTGASRHKQLMRFAGVILGGCVIGFGTQALILPQIDSLFAFTILFAAVTAIGAWVGTSGPRIAYAGAQIVLAYDLVNLNRFTITTSLVPARDTVLGIMLGIFAMWLIFDHLWPTSSTESMRSLFLSTVEELAAFDVPIGPLSSRAQSHYLLSTGDRINTQLDRLRNVVDFSVFEPYSKSSSEEYLAECIKTLQPQLRCFLLMKIGLLEHRLTSKAPEADDLVSAVQHRSSAILREAAQTLEAGRQPQEVEPANLAELTRSVMGTLATARTEGRTDLMMQMRLSASLLDVAHDLGIEWLNLAQSYKQQARAVSVA